MKDLGRNCPGLECRVTYVHVYMSLFIRVYPNRYQINTGSKHVPALKCRQDQAVSASPPLSS